MNFFTCSAVYLLAALSDYWWIVASSHHPNQIWLIINHTQGTDFTKKLTSSHWRNLLSAILPLFCPGEIFQHVREKNLVSWKSICAGIHRSPVDSPHKGQWRGASMFSLISAWINSWVNNCEAGDLTRHRAHYDVTVMRLHWNSPFHLLYWPFDDASFV